MTGLQNRPKVSFHTLGCKVNQYETDAVAKSFTDAGFEIVGFQEKCDVYVINTCTVTGEADRKSRQHIHRARAANSDAIIVAMGCLSELSGETLSADIIIGNVNKCRAADIVKEFMLDKFTQNSSDRLPDFFLSNNTFHKYEFDEMGQVTSHDLTRAYIKIEDGCNNYCSYCIIPFVRGNVRSRDEEQIIKEANALAETGYKEVVLTGIHICSYRAEYGESSLALAQLTNKISQIEGIERIRFGSLEPNSITREFVEKISGIDKLCSHFHISLQSGSDTVLKRMNRKYSTSDFFEIIKLIHEHIPGALITTDIITGFPGETQKEHKETMAFCELMNFSHMHVFKYSKRDSTAAALMTDQVSPNIKTLRSRELIALSEKMRRQHLMNSVGQRFFVLSESYIDGIITGYTETYLPIRIMCEESNYRNVPKRGEILEITAISASDEAIIAKI